METRLQKYTTNGFENIKAIKPNDNLIIKGDNLAVMNSIKKDYSGKVKLIYIDPPYNTQKNNFKYKDKMAHNNWIAFMKSRLEIAKDFLRDDGVIFVSIDDNEQAYLKILMDEIFGRENFISNLFVVNNLKGNNDAKHFANVGEYLLVFSKNKSQFRLKGISVTDEKELHSWQKDSKGFWKKGRNLKATGRNAIKQGDKDTLFFPLFISDNNKISLTQDEEFYLEVKPITNSVEMRWDWSKDKFENNKDEILVFRTKNGISIHKKQRPNNKENIITKKAKTLFYEPSYSNTTSANHLKKMFGNRVFDYSKSEFLIKDIIEISTQEGDLVMDFFLGSGTTTAVAHKMNRKYIGIEQMDYIEDITLERMKKVVGRRVQSKNSVVDSYEIEFDEGGISKDVVWTGGGDFIYCE